MIRGVGEPPMRVGWNYTHIRRIARQDCGRNEETAMDKEVSMGKRPWKFIEHMLQITAIAYNQKL